MYFALGLSHIVPPRAWTEFFLLLKSQGKGRYLCRRLRQPLLGAIIVSFHNVWHGLTMVMTIIGWGQAIKGLRIMVLPQSHLNQIERRISLERAWMFRPAGVMLVALSVLFGYVAFTH